MILFGQSLKLKCLVHSLQVLKTICVVCASNGHVKLPRELSARIKAPTLQHSCKHQTQDHKFAVLTNWLISYDDWLVGSLSVKS